jgi:uncharacterized protein involved in exopolysaccharide biosynthesis
MSDSSSSSTSALSLSAFGGRGRGLRYLAVGMAANAAIWGTALFLVKESPRIYSSQWSMIFLGRGTKAQVSLPNIGSASTVAESPFNRDNDVKASYKMIATTDAVRQTAAAKLGMTKGNFGKPTVEVVEGTPLMNLTLTGSTPEEAQKKAYALSEAFQERLGQLRVQQSTGQEAVFENTLSVARRKLESAQRQLSEYKVVSGLISNNQVDQLAANIEQLRKLRAETSAQERDTTVRSQQLSTTLNTSAQSASEAFILRSDPLFQQHVKDASEATASLTSALAKFGPNHPLVVQSQATQEAIQAALQSRAETLLGRAADPTALARLNIGGGQGQTARESLFQDVVRTTAEHQGLTARTQELNRQIVELEARLSILAQRSSNLESLNRNMQIAEAVFSSTLAGLDASKGDVFGAYPPVQIVVEPSLPKEPTVPQKLMLVGGAAVGSGLVSLGLFLIWLRKTAPVQKWLTQRAISF